MIQLSVWQPLEICKLKFLISDLRLGDQARYFNCVSQFHWLHSWFLHNFRTFRIENDLLYSNIQNIRNPQDNQNFRLNFRGYAIALYFPIIIYDKKRFISIQDVPNWRNCSYKRKYDTIDSHIYTYTNTKIDIYELSKMR